MIDVEKLKKIQVISRRMYLINHICGKMGLDIYYLFGLLNMYNVKNRGRWFWQKAAFTGVLKDDFDKFNSYMDNFAGKFRSYDESKINAALSESQTMLEKLVSDLETSLFITRESDEMTVRTYVDDNLKSLINSNLKQF